VIFEIVRAGTENDVASVRGRQVSYLGGVEIDGVDDAQCADPRSGLRQRATRDRACDCVVEDEPGSKCDIGVEAREVTEQPGALVAGFGGDRLPAAPQPPTRAVDAVGGAHQSDAYGARRAWGAEVDGAVVGDAEARVHVAAPGCELHERLVED
jgi:hypothetical protein